MKLQFAAGCLLACAVPFLAEWKSEPVGCGDTILDPSEMDETSKPFLINCVTGG